MNHSLHELSFVTLPASQVEWKLLYKDSGSGAKLDGSCWRPIPPPGLVNVGDTFVIGHESPSQSTQPINQYVDKSVYQPINQMTVLFAVDRPEVVKRSTKPVLVWSDRGSGAKQDIELYEGQAEEGYISLGLYANIDNPEHYLVNETLVTFDNDFSTSDASWCDLGSNSNHHIQTFYNSSYHTFVCTTSPATKVPLIGFRIGALTKSAEIKLPTCKKWLPNSVAPYEDVKELLAPKAAIASTTDGPAVDQTSNTTSNEDQQADDGQFHQEDFQMV